MDGKREQPTSNKGLRVQSPKFSRSGQRVLILFETDKKNIEDPKYVI